MLLECFLGSSPEERRVALFEAFGGGADVTAPTLLSATIDEAGTSLTLVFDEAVTFGAGGNGGWVPTLTGGAATLTYASGAGTTTLVYTLSRTVDLGETGTVAYTQPSGGVEDAAGNDLAEIVDGAVTNNSTQGGGPTLVISDDFAYSDGELETVSSAVWVVKSGGITVDTGRVIANNASHSLAHHTTAVNADMRSEITYAVDGASYIGVAVRVQSSGDNGYVCFYDGTDLHLWQISSGAETVIQTAAVGSITKIALEASGAGALTRLKVQVDTGSGWVDQWTDQNPAVDHDGGFAGVSGYAAGASAGDAFRAYNL